jgi:2-hydroxychromene-2-carboxylate isomerase
MAYPATRRIRHQAEARLQSRRRPVEMRMTLELATRDLDFYFDFLSPYTFLASRALPKLARTHGLNLRYRPMNLVALMQQVGNRPTTLECANKGAYVMVDIGRSARRAGVPFVPNPAWPAIDFPRLARGALVASDLGGGAAYIDAIFAAVWIDAADLSRADNLARVIGATGLSAEELLRRADSEDGIARLDRATDEAARRGVFGSPTMVLGKEMFFGNDRLDMLAETLATRA